MKISEIWSLLTVKTSVPRSRQRLVFHGKTLQPDSTLRESSITNESVIHLIVPPGAPKKQKCTFKDCKDGAQRIVGDCGFCRGHFCGKHRLLEDHKCDGLEDVSLLRDCRRIVQVEGAYANVGPLSVQERESRCKRQQAHLRADDGDQGHLESILSPQSTSSPYLYNLIWRASQRVADFGLSAVYFPASFLPCDATRRDAYV